MPTTTKQSHISLDQMISAKDEDSQREILCDINKQSPSRVMKEVRQQIINRRPAHRAVACWVMGELGYPKRPFLKERFELLANSFINDTSPNVRAKAAISLGRLAYKQADELLAQSINQRNQKVRLAVTQALAIRGERHLVNALIKLSNDKSPDVRDWAVFGLGLQDKHNQKLIVKTLRSKLNDKSHGVRMEAICGLINQGDFEAVTPLCEALLDQGVEYRLVQAVGELKESLQGNPYR